MYPTNDNLITLSVLNSIIDGCPPAKDGRVSQFIYMLGQTYGISNIKELMVIRNLHRKKVIDAPKYARSNGVSFYSINDDFTQSVRVGHPADLINGNSNAYGHTEPVSVGISFYVEAVNQEIKNLKSEPDEIKSESRILSKDDDGFFYFKGQLLMTDGRPLDSGVKHYKILDILFTLGDQNGMVSTSKLIQALRKRGEWENKSDDQVIKGIRNAIDNSLFAKVQVGGGIFKNESLQGKPLVAPYKEMGSLAGWRLYNPKFN